MTPQLPPNSWTITDNRARVYDVSWLGDNEHWPRGELLRIEEHLRLLHQYDNYERQTCEQREAIKLMLHERKAVICSKQK